MGLTTSETPKANGLKTALDIVIAPREALERLRTAPTWGWALLIALVAYTLGSYLVTPALLHAMQSDWPRQVAANPQMASMPPQSQQKILDFTLRVVAYTWCFTLAITPFIVFVHALIMLAFNAIGRGQARFASLWAAAANIAIPGLGIAALLAALIALLRGPDSFNSAAEVQSAVPSLALLVPTASVKLHAFLSMFNPFSLWTLGLTVATMSIVARVSRVWAWTPAVLMFLLSASLVALGAR